VEQISQCAFTHPFLGPFLTMIQYIAKQLLARNEKWTPVSEIQPEQILRQDNEIFDIARSITCIHFMNVVKKDFIKALLGKHVMDPDPEADISYVCTMVISCYMPDQGHFYRILNVPRSAVAISLQRNHISSGT
jgi:hypothetical protein